MPDYPTVPQQISDPISENLAKLAGLFPAAVKDGSLDVEALRAELGDFEEIKPGDETYELSWVGKQAAKKEAFKPLLGKTLSLIREANQHFAGQKLEYTTIVCRQTNGHLRLYFIIETKMAKEWDDLTPVEQSKIKCGELHFKAVSNEIKFDWVNSYKSFKAKIG